MWKEITISVCNDNSERMEWLWKHLEKCSPSKVAVPSGTFLHGFDVFSLFPPGTPISYRTQKHIFLSTKCQHVCCRNAQNTHRGCTSTSHNLPTTLNWISGKEEDGWRINVLSFCPPSRVSQSMSSFNTSMNLVPHSLLRPASQLHLHYIHYLSSAHVQKQSQPGRSRFIFKINL